jgi:hypothetical protein
VGRTIEEAKEAAVQVLLHNLRGPHGGLPRTAGWGYPQPYTRDLMISSLGILVSGRDESVDGLRRTLLALAENQTELGQRLFGHHASADGLRALMNRLDIRRDRPNRHIHEGLVVAHKPDYAMSAWKVSNIERFDLLGNCLAVLTGIASASRATALICWIETECDALRDRGDLAGQ